MRGRLMKNPFRFSVDEDVVVKFIAGNFDTSKALLVTDERFESFRSLACNGKELLAAKEYESLTGASLAECHLATSFTKSLKGSLS